MATQVLGRIGRDPQLTVSGDSSRLNFSLAEDRSYRDARGNKVARTQWYSCTIWGKRAESLAKYITKGDQILLSGDVSASVWFDREGEAQASLDLNVQKVDLLDNRGRGTSGSSAPAHEEESVPAEKPKRASSRATPKTPRKGKRVVEQQELPEPPADNGGFDHDDLPF